jgi:class 3 adenylate cyclase
MDQTNEITASVKNHIFESDAFSRLDETEDRLFYSTDRFVDHLDAPALCKVEKIIGNLIVKKEPVILDMMAGWNSHIPDDVKPGEFIGLGLNKRELIKNKALTKFIVQDINQNIRFPFPDDYFDVVLNVVSIAYITRPIEIFRETGRVLKKSGLFLIIFSNRMFPQKAVKIWRKSKIHERLLLLGHFFRASQFFGDPFIILSEGNSNPPLKEEIKPTFKGNLDPVYAVYAYKKGRDVNYNLNTAELRSSKIDIIRENIVVLVASLKNFEVAAKTLSPQQVILILSRCYSRLSSIVNDYGGIVCGYEKDSMLVFFRSITEMKSIMEKSLTCAIALQKVMMDLNNILHQREVPNLQLGTGIHSGEAIIGGIPFVRGIKFSGIGNVIQTAYRIEEVASGGQILISPPVYSEISDSIQIKNTITEKIEGFESPLDLFEIAYS